jgi:hypothetical protein
VPGYSSHIIICWPLHGSARVPACQPLTCALIRALHLLLVHKKTMKSKEVLITAAHSTSSAKYGGIAGAVIASHFFSTDRVPGCSGKVLKQHYWQLRGQWHTINFRSEESRAALHATAHRTALQLPLGCTELRAVQFSYERQRDAPVHKLCKPQG